MPKIVIDGFEIRIYTRNERGHRPHVHVYGSSGSIVIEIARTVHVRGRYTMKRSEARRALRVFAWHQGHLMEIWRDYRG